MLPKHATHIKVKGRLNGVHYYLIQTELAINIVNMDMVGDIVVEYYDSGCMCQRKTIYGKIENGVLVLDM